MPGLPIAIYTDRDDVKAGVFDRVLKIESPTYSDYDKQFGFREFLFEKTLFLDSDTMVCAPFPELFDLLERFDMAGTREFWSGAKEFGPISYDVFNGGVIVFASRPQVRRTLDRWREIAVIERERAGKRFNDQDSFRQATYENVDLHVYVLPNHYNLRLTAPQVVNVWARPVILHGRSSRLEELAEALMRTHEHRLLVPNLSTFERLEWEVVDKRSARVLGPLVALARGVSRLARKAGKFLT